MNVPKSNTSDTMSSQEVFELLLPAMYNAAVRAGAAIMQIHGHKDDYQISLKNDKTPITLADRQAHRVIRESLGSTRIPILSEEGREMRFEERCNWELYWLVDPLDGTAEFIEGYNEFTVNIALMENNCCIAAVIYVPYFEKMYIAGQGRGAFLKQGVVPDAEADYSYMQIISDWRPLPLTPTTPERNFRVALSRRHRTEETYAHIDTLRAAHPDLEIVEQGSSYKFCMLAEGTVDYYVRTTHTYEWDTAAGELILAEAGGMTRTLPDEGALRYNEENLHNPWFYCRR
jgi:3'(2'), 5'-bisphosphate nucleotidase